MKPLKRSLIHTAGIILPFSLGNILDLERSAYWRPLASPSTICFFLPSAMPRALNDLADGRKILQMIIPDNLLDPSPARSRSLPSGDLSLRGIPQPLPRYRSYCRTIHIASGFPPGKGSASPR